MEGLLTREQVDKGRVKWLTINQQNGEFDMKGASSTFPILSGKLLGFSTHTFDYKGKPTEKLDIFVQANGETYNAQFGVRNWMSWRLLNMLMSTFDTWTGNEKILIRSEKDKDGNFNVSVAINGTYCKWKFKWNEVFKDLDDAQVEARRNKMIDQWLAALIGKFPYTPSAADCEEEDYEEDEVKDPISDEVPF